MRPITAAQAGGSSGRVLVGLAVSAVELIEVGPREGFQFEGIDEPDKISTTSKLRLVDELTKTGVHKIQVTSFVSPKIMPQMADAEELSDMLPDVPQVEYLALVLNVRGLERAAATGRYLIRGSIGFSASETFAKKNQNRDFAQEVEMNRLLIDHYHSRGVPITRATVSAAFGCNYEGDIPATRVVEVLRALADLAQECGDSIEDVLLADTMGWADPERLKETVSAVRTIWPELRVGLHLHDTRGSGMANVYAGLEMEVTTFETSVGGLGGCPFAGTVAGNVPTEDVVFMCERMGIETGIDLDTMVYCARIAEEIVGHQLPSRMGKV